jgi:AcrR family transcriptional regulator
MQRRTPATERFDHAERRAAILDASLGTFLRYGYAKTSMNDIAEACALSRSLLYLEFATKEDLFGALLERLFDAQYARAKAVLAGKGSRRDKLLGVLEAWVLDLYERIGASSHADELFAEGYRIYPSMEAQHRRRGIEVVDAVLGDRPLAEVLLLSVKGLEHDRPKPSVLRERVTLLAERMLARTR